VQGINVPSKVFGERALHELGTPEISVEELAGRIARGERMILVDSRTPEEYARGCIPGAVSVPGGELVLRIAELVPSPDTPIVVHCGGRTRSYIGAESVRRMGLANPVAAVKNGTMGWHLAGLELERGASRWAPPVTERGRAAAEPVARRVAAEDGIAFVSPEELRALLAARDRDNVHVFDVRTREEYAAGHIAGAVWVPGGQAVQATDECVAVRAASIVLACDGAVRAVMTASWLRRMGFPRVSVLRGGLPAWIAAGGATERGFPEILPSGYARARAAIETLTPVALARERRDGAAPAVIDVDQSDVYASGHVPGAGWICRSRLERRLREGAIDRARPVVVTCADGLVSTLAAATLAGLGVPARALDGGTRAWRTAGFELERGPTRLLDEPDDVTPKPYDRGRAAMEAYLTWEEHLDAEGRSPHLLVPPLDPERRQ
jgi:rhodanese-related sulfurtransferase